jgi:RNA polymerase sigma factor (sigma-70 family)
LTLRSRGGILQQFHPDFEAALRDGDPGPERLAMDRQTLMRMHEALEQLSPRQREYLQLRAEGLRYQEIAGALGVGVSTVSQFLTRAISRLRQAVYE